MSAAFLVFAATWCEVDFVTYASTVAPNVHVIGDAIDAGLPKSAHMANAQARVCASAIVALMRGEAPDPAPAFANTCYSFVDDRQAMHISTQYQYDAAKKSMQQEGGSVLSAQPSVGEGIEADAWARGIWTDVLAEGCSGHAFAGSALSGF